ncbi:MAG: DUF1501 domain-containing protein [Verrucomicrobiota bacterium]
MSVSQNKLFSRREMLRRSSSGFGMLALSGLLRANSGAAPHHVPRAKNVIFCYMSGGVSQVDSFDPKPRLAREAGEDMPMKVERTQFNNNGKIMPSPFEFKRYGESGLPVSDMFPSIGAHADDLAVIRSMTTTVNEHAQGNFMMHTGFPFLGFPSAGAWTSYGLGSANENLPSYIVLQSGKAVAPHGGVPLFSSGFLPAQHQASILKADSIPAIPNVKPAGLASDQRRRIDFVRGIDRDFNAAIGGDPAVEAAIQNYETAYRMQSAVPEVCDISGESEATRKLYGLDDPDAEKAAYARQALLARRLVERGVRFVELSCLSYGIGAGGAANPWDQHNSLEKGHQAMANQVDQPIGALLTDLKSRGLLDETLVVFTGEFGRTPFSQGSNGRDHDPHGFSLWMAGGGTKGGTIHGATDEYGYHVTENKRTIFDLWATVLHLLGIDHEDLTYRYAGRNVRLTDVHGHVVREVIA